MEKRIRELIDRINEASYNYYVLDSPTISDKQWDSLYDELLELEKQSGIVYDDSPSKRVGGEILSGFPSHTHITRLYSMDKVKSFSALEDWIKKVQNFVDQYNKDNAEKLNSPEFCVEYKLDGLSINLSYDNAKLVQAATRGNGIVGESILAQAKTIKSIPLTISNRKFMEIGGECIMKLSALKEYNKKSDEPLKNARNAAAGAIRCLDPRETAKKRLDVFFYNLSSYKGLDFETYIDTINFIKSQKLPVSPYIKLCKDKNEVIQAIKEIEENRENLDFLIDGAVVKVNDLKTREALGYTEKFPRWAMAYKFKAEENISRLKKVMWNVGRTGKITPLAILEPVDFDGVTVSKATLNNIGDIERKKLKINCDVWIRRSNDVIPEILGRTDSINENEKDIFKPEYCPSCKGKLIENGANIFCTAGINCKAQAIARIEHFVSRDAMNIEGFSTKTAELLYEKNLIRDVADIYSLEYDKLIQLDKFKEKKTNKLLKEIEKSKNIPLNQFIYSLGILNVGKKTARLLSEKFEKLEGIMNASLDELSSIDEVGDIIAKSIQEYFKDEYNNQLIIRLLEAGITFTNKAKKDSNASAFNNKSFVLTGSLEGMTRKEACEIIENHGGNILNSVSKNTDYVLAGDKAGSKLLKAQKLGIKIIDLNEFLNMINN